MAASIGEHARLPAGSIIQGRYSILHELGCGNFAKVYCCRDEKRTNPNDPELVAVKVLKREYANDARYEADILKVITSKNPDARHSVLTVVDNFTWGRYPVFVFPLKGPTLRQRKLGAGRTSGCSVDDVRRFAYDMLRALSFLHFDVKLIHTDLKPENILLDTATPTGIGAKWTIADFGSASFYRPEKLDSDLISTRPYRAPEVVLGGSWYYPADIWSMACIIFEVFTGSRLFDVHDDMSHLAMMEARLGPLPECLTTGLRHSRKFYSMGKLQCRTSGSTAKSLVDALSGEPLLADLLQRMLSYDPTTRLRADKALSHPFFESMGCLKSPTSAAECAAAYDPVHVRKQSGPRDPSPPAEGAAAMATAAASPAATSSAVCAAAAAAQKVLLPASRAASPLLPCVSTNSYEALKNAKYRRGIMTRPVLPPAGSKFSAAAPAMHQL